MFVCLYVCISDPGGKSHVRLGEDALHSTCKRCHSKTDGECERRASMQLSHGSAPPGEFMWHYVATIRLRLLS